MRWWKQAKELFKDAQVILKRILDEKLTAKAIFGIFKANSNETDDILIFDENNNEQASFNPKTAGSKIKRKRISGIK
jgi:cobalamin-dependent methionine synthase I